MLEPLKRILIGKTLTLEAKLKGVAGFTGSGVFCYDAWSDGHVTFDADLKGVAGLKAEIWARGRMIGPLTVRDGKVYGEFDSRSGAVAPVLAAGDIVEIRQNGDVILQGGLG